MAQTITNLTAMTAAEATKIEALLTRLLGDVPEPEVVMLGSDCYPSYRVRKYDALFWATAQGLLAHGVPVQDLTVGIVNALRNGFSIRNNNTFWDAAREVEVVVTAELPEALVQSTLPLTVVEGGVPTNGTSPEEVLGPPAIPYPVEPIGQKGGQTATAAPVVVKTRKIKGGATKTEETPAVRHIIHTCGCKKTHRLRGIDRQDKKAVAAEVARLTALSCPKHGGTA